MNSAILSAINDFILENVDGCSVQLICDTFGLPRDVVLRYLSSLSDSGDIVMFKNKK